MSALSFEIDALGGDDYPAWLALARGYHCFYETELPDGAYHATWARLLHGDSVHGRCARAHDGRLLGLVHDLFHASSWSADVCYLQDLFVPPTARGQGVARALITQVAVAARARNAPRLYWSTHQNNTRARRLYDRVASHQGFVRYDYPLA